MGRRRKLTLHERGIMYWAEGVMLFGTSEERKKIRQIVQQFERRQAEKFEEELMVRVRGNI